MSAVVPGICVTMPQLGETVAEGTVSRWLKKVGDSVSADEPLLEVATDKVDTEIPSPATGTVLDILVPEGETVPVGCVLTRIGTASLDGPAGRRVAPTSSAPGAHRSDAAHADVDSEPSTAARPGASAHRHRHSPRMRRLARDAGVDLRSVHGSGPAGRVVRGDVLNAAGRLDHGSDATFALPDAGRGLRSAMSAAPVSARAAGVAVVEIDVTHLRPMDNPGSFLLAIVAAEAMRALRRQHLTGSAAPGPELEVNGRLIVGAGDLTAAALLRRIAEGPSQPQSGAHGRLALWNDGGDSVLLHTRPVGTQHLAALSIGAIAERPIVLRRTGGDHAITVGSLVHLTLSYDISRVNPDAAIAFLTMVAERVGDPAYVQSVAPGGIASPPPDP